MRGLLIIALIHETLWSVSDRSLQMIWGSDSYVLPLKILLELDLEAF